MGQLPAPGLMGANLPGAWDITTGSASVYVAVIDTGIRPHADLAGRYIGGYDFISTLSVANDGNLRDNDPSDPGDWVAANECGAGSTAYNSSWHGTHVAGTVAAASNNGSGVTGINWVSKVVPVRVLGKCGGYTSDIVDGMRWAAGFSVTGVPANPYPAKVMNLSLGGSGACSSTYQNAINTAGSTCTTSLCGAGIVNAAGAVAAAQNPPPPSPPGAFGKSAPSNGATNRQTSLTLSWAASSGAISYEVCVDTTNDSACAGAWTNVGVATSRTVSGLARKTTYYWQVRANNAGGQTQANTGTWWRFTTR